MAKKEPHQQMEVIPPGRALAPFVPPQQEVVEGFENMQTEHITRPRLALCQSQTLQRDKDDPKYIKGLEEGEFFNTITGERYGTKVTLSPLMFFIYRLRFGNPKERDDETEGLMCQSLNGLIGIGNPGGVCQKCPMKDWANNEKPRCTQIYGYASLIIPAKGDIKPDNLVVVGLKSANVGLAKDWNALMRLRTGKDGKRLPMWAGMYSLTSKKKKFNLGSAFIAIPENAGQHELGSSNGNICRSSYYMIKELYDSGKLEVDSADFGREPGE